MVAVHPAGDAVEVLQKQADLPNGLHIVGPGEQASLIVLVHLQILRQGHGADADEVGVHLVHHVGGVQGALAGVLPPPHAGHVELIDLNAGGLGLDAGLDLGLLGDPLPHALQNLVVARLQADVEAVELQLGIALQPLGLQAVDGVRPGIGGDALDLGESGVEVLQHVSELVRGHEQTVAVLEKHRLHAALHPVIGHGAGLVIPLGLGLPGGLLPLKDIHPVFDEVNVLLHVLGPPDAEGHVPVKAAEPALVPAAAPVDPQQQTVRLTGGTDGPQLEPVVWCDLLQSRVLLFDF